MTVQIVLESDLVFRAVMILESIRSHAHVVGDVVAGIETVVKIDLTVDDLFIILDEILKGTNSMDKQKGSFALVRQLMELKTNGIIATHDLLLGKLIEYFPKEIRNYCFEADITNDELTFSYKLREGIAQNMNAFVHPVAILPSPKADSPRKRTKKEPMIKIGV